MWFFIVAEDQTKGRMSAVLVVASPVVTSAKIHANYSEAAGQIGYVAKRASEKRAFCQILSLD